MIHARYFLLGFHEFRQVGRFGMASVVLTLGVGAGELLIARRNFPRFFQLGQLPAVQIGKDHQIVREDLQADAAGETLKSLEKTPRQAKRAF
jgi:hypothetical protein